MSLIYAHGSVPGSKKGGAFRAKDPHPSWVEHHKNSIRLLQFMCSGTFEEKADARVEMIICDRKKKYWEQQPDFSMQTAIKLLRATR